MRRQTCPLAAVLGSLLLLALSSASRRAEAVNPLESPDNGASALARGGANLAEGVHPLSVHYAPASLATQASASSIDLRLSIKDTCFDRRGPGGEVTGPTEGFQYVETCNARRAFPVAIPAIAVVWRATPRLGLGLAAVPPAAYGTASTEWPALSPVLETQTNERRPGPAPYRYMTLGNQSTILLPTVSAGYALTDALRVGAGFISGLAVINVRTASMSSVGAGQTQDEAADDSASTLRTQDLFMPGVVLSAHWSPAPMLDVAVWGRWVDAIESDDGELIVETQYYARPGLDEVAPICGVVDDTCTTAIVNRFDDDDFERFRFAYPPPEARVGVRYHHPRTMRPRPPEVRDPLADDVFDIELDGSYTMNSAANEVVVRFREEQGGVGPSVTPVGDLPPIADRATGFIDSYGARLGGQLNVLPGRFAVLAGGWVESRSQDPALLDVSQPGPLRGGFGGGFVLRQGVFDFSMGYQFHASQPLDNRGQGRSRAAAGVELGDGFSVDDEPRSLPAAERREFRSPYASTEGG